MGFRLLPLIPWASDRFLLGPLPARLASDVLGNTSGFTGLFLHLLSDRLSITDTRFVARRHTDRIP
jgi:hypothetical protein